MLKLQYDLVVDLVVLSFPRESGSLAAQLCSLPLFAPVKIDSRWNVTQHRAIIMAECIIITQPLQLEAWVWNSSLFSHNQPQIEALKQGSKCKFLPCRLKVLENSVCLTWFWNAFGHLSHHRQPPMGKVHEAHASSFNLSLHDSICGIPPKRSWRLVGKRLMLAQSVAMN